jgi:PIN domain nuclease of toxin-antitoxin system
MRLLLDTHIFLWYVTADTRLPMALRDSIRDPANEVYLSVVSIWEALVKHQTGKLILPNLPEAYLLGQRDRHNILSLALDEESVAQLPTLPPLHRDPFDRMLICQAKYHRLTIASRDAAIQSYPVTVIDE